MRSNSKDSEKSALVSVLSKFPSKKKMFNAMNFGSKSFEYLADFPL